MPQPKANAPHWLELKLPKAAEVSRVHVTFESKAVACAVEAWRDGKWAKVGKITAGAPRRSVVRFDPVKTDRIRLMSESPAVVVCEMRVYN
jgi:hypothetical protein